MKKYFLTFCALLATALTFTSCLSTSNSENVYTATLGSAECFARVYDMETQETITTQGASYSFKFNFTDGTIQPEIANLQLAPNFGGLTFKLHLQRSEPHSRQRTRHIRVRQILIQVNTQPCI